MRDLPHSYIDGRWALMSGADALELINPSTGSVSGRVALGTAADVSKATSAAKAAFEEWSGASPTVRADHLYEVVRIMVQRGQEFADLICSEVGMPIKQTETVQVRKPIEHIANFARLARDFQYQRSFNDALVIQEPIGVCGLIVPWNFPLHEAVIKVAPALAAGCTVVLKPSEITPFSAHLLAQVIEEACLPHGVFNLVNGRGPIVGEAIASDPDVAMVSFTGSTRAGKRVAELASKTVKRVVLELGGKSASIILDDADLPKAVEACVQGCFMNSGQTCSAPTRMLVPRKYHDRAADIARTIADSFVLGDPRDARTTLGPVVHSAQYTKVISMIERGITEGATLLTGGTERPHGLERGYFVKPTVFANVTNDMAIAQEEIFGPVLSVIAYDNDLDAIRIANDSIYGLAGGVWSSDHERALKVAKQIRAGQVRINDSASNVHVPFGGYKQSGIGRELGEFGFAEYLETKAILGGAR